MSSATTESQVTPAPALVEALHQQNVVHPNHGYDTFKEGCPTCDLLGKLIVGAAVVTHGNYVEENEKLRAAAQRVVAVADQHSVAEAQEGYIDPAVTVALRDLYKALGSA